MVNNISTKTTTASTKTTFTTTRETGTGLVLVKATVDYPVPAKGDVVVIYGHEITVGEVTIGVDFEFDSDSRRYVGKPLMTKEPNPRLVFHIRCANRPENVYSWRRGEYFTAQ